ncbi:hypothetical protein GCM10018790_38210 [Kitasatospora xanthocidica]|uniref:hypothetical protein n=1 Tax=Kitasatospora xanthocidica TaxID=83382 RepID=UPI001673A116|nr:hypothetical protein [Kitasatospora xanthocidica]GHF56579.1 hypothetical protein GCM10018790_38210 [Kitasatospora xanthocidica]
MARTHIKGTGTKHTGIKHTGTGQTGDGGTGAAQTGAGGTGLKGRGSETFDSVLAVVLGALTATTDGWLLSVIWQDAHEQTAVARRDSGSATLILIALVLFTALLGAAVAGQHSTPHRRWRCAMLGPVLGHLALPALLVVWFLFNPPAITIPW